MGQRRVTEAFIGNEEASELLGVQPSNVVKMLERAGLEPQELRQGPTRKRVRVWDRAEVEALRDRRAADTAAREADEKRRLAAQAKAAGA